LAAQRHSILIQKGVFCIGQKSLQFRLIVTRSGGDPVNLSLLPEEEKCVSSLTNSERQIALFGTGTASLSDLQRVASDAGMKVATEIDLSSGHSGRDFDFRGDFVFVDIGGAPVAADDPMLETLTRLDAVARERQTPVIANTTANNLDALAARLSGATVTLMCDADNADWAVALSLSQVEGHRARELKTDEAVRLQRLSDEVERIARILATLAENRPEKYSAVQEAPRGFRAQPVTRDTTTVSASDVRKIVRLRRMRDQFFRSDLFADPAWDMLLDLMLARLERSAIAVSSLCIAAAVPPTTALRWIKTMTEDGTFVRVADPDDGRRIFIELSDDAAAKMLAYLSAATAQGGLAI
jgi:hypothetical protein